ncbi:hypothetical protein BG000_007566 [Podila horticola]|nr:hypothetical protein BG000_007566 [Podila horticola]
MSPLVFNRSRFEDFVARLGHMRDVDLDHITIEDEPTCGLQNNTVSIVVMDPKVNVQKYFPGAGFYTLINGTTLARFAQVSKGEKDSEPRREGLKHLRPEFDVAKYPPNERDDDDGVLEVTF